MSDRVNQSTDVNTTESINIESSEKVAKNTRKEMQKKTEENNEVATDAKPKLIIKIPKPFALGYIVIDLSKLLGKLLAGLSAAVLALVMAKIADFIAEKLKDRLAENLVNQSDIDGAIKSADVDAMIKESEDELKKMKSLDSEIDPSERASRDDGKIVDVYSKPNVNKKNIANKNKYTIDKRNRKDVLDSDVVKERNGSNNKNIKTVKNPNYGTYLD